MNDDLHNIDDLFKKALEQHHDLPSPAVWNNIDKSLDKKKVISIAKKYNNLKWAAAVLLLFSFGMAMYTLYTGIRNKELVKENESDKIFKNKNIKTSNSGKDSLTAASKTAFNNAGAESKEELKSQANNTGNKVITSPAINVAENNNTTDKAKQYINQLPDNTGTNTTRIMPTGSAGVANVVTKQAHILPTLKNKPIKSKLGNKQEQRGETVTANYSNTGLPDSVANTKYKDVITNTPPADKLIAAYSTKKQKYFTDIPVIAKPKDMFPALTMNRSFQFLKIPGEPNAFKDNKRIQQKNIAKKGNPSLLSVTLFFSPDLVSTNLKEDNPHFREENRRQIEQDEQFESASAIGAFLDFKTGKNWILETGLTYSTRSANIRPKIIYARPDNNGNIFYRLNFSAGYSFIMLKSASLPASGDSIRALTSKNTLQYAGVPLAVKYVLSKGKFSLIPGIGISANFLTRGKIKTTVATVAGNQDATSYDIQGLKSMYLNGSVSLGAEYKLSRNFALTFIPTARFALSPINQNAPVKTYLNSIGLATGATIQF